MRRIGLVETSSQATRFCDYLLTQEIAATMEPAGDDRSPQYEIWVKDEQKVDAAKAALGEFLKSPDDPRYSVSAAAAKRRVELDAENKRRLKNQQKVRHRGLPGATSARRPAVVLFAIALCVGVGLLTDFHVPRLSLSPQGTLEAGTELRVFNALMFVSYEDAARSDNPFASILRGEVWRLITPALLHGNIGHLAMNMIGLFLLGGAVERAEGKLKIALLLVATAVAGTVVQALWPESNGGGPGGIGASGAAYGLFGYLWMRPLYEPNFEVRLPPSALFLGMMFLLLGLASVIQGIANGAHVGGLVAGMLLATAFRTPAKGGSG
ncbi:MAG: rhomboid family intramembrane serine protease [Planctomycetaceae bacterium]